MPFKLLFSRQLRGLLDTVRKAWEEQPSPFCFLIDYIQELQEWIDWVAPIIWEYMQAAQKEQQRVYNWPTQP